MRARGRPRSARRRRRRAGTGRSPSRAQPLELRPPDGEQVVLGPIVRSRSRAGYRPTSILVIFERALLAAGQRDLDLVVALAADERLADRRLVGELLRRRGLGGADDRELLRLAVLVLDVDARADRRRRSTVGGVDDLRGAELLLELRMRVSSMACSFLASSYSEFSEMSPNSRASLMRSATSRRFTVASCSSSSLSFSRPSWVRMTSLGMAVQVFRLGPENPTQGGASGGRPG